MTSWNKPKIPLRSVSEGLDLLGEPISGTHCLMVYPDLMTLRGMYSHYTKTQLEDNEVVLILPYYETVDMVRFVLSGRDVYFDNWNNPFGYSGIDVNRYEKAGSLMLKDSLEGYFPSEELSSYHNNSDKPKGGIGLMSFIDVLLKHAERRRKNGITVMADMGSFYHYYDKGNQNLIEYERSLPKKFDRRNLRAFCLYHQRDFERHFGKEEQASLLDCHDRSMMLMRYANSN
ncbi:MAG: hypothetical protein WAL46_06145 [Nitrososphaeraceae archaeon]